MQKNDYIFEEFEKDIWLYLDNDLPEERMNYWEVQIQNNPDIKQKLEEYQNFLSIYNDLSAVEFNQQKFNVIIDKTIKHEHLFSIIKSFFNFSNEHDFFIPKIAFVTSLSVAAIVMLILSQKPNPVNTISNDLLGWDDAISNVQIQNISNSISLIENDKMKNYMIYKSSQVKWNRDINRIENQLKNLDEEISETSL